jgi:hypothetical protein
MGVESGIRWKPRPESMAIDISGISAANAAEPAQARKASKAVDQRCRFAGFERGQRAKLDEQEEQQGRYHGLMG